MKNLSIFRYPGAKNKLLPILDTYLDLIISNQFADAFVGGGSVLISIAQKYPQAQLICNDLDKGIYNFWKVISSNDIIKLQELISLVRVQPTIEQFYKLRQTPPQGEIEEAYQALYFNRCCFSGINKTNSSPIGGKNQNSKWTVDCRYNSNKLIEKIIKLNDLLKNRLIVENLDIIDFLKKYPETPAYLDAPYYKMGHQLYQEWMRPNQHIQLAETLKTRTNWIASYDNCEEIINLYSWAKIDFIDAKYSINGKKTEWKKCKEVVICPK